MISQNLKVSKSIKCRFCNWEVPRFRTSSKGKVTYNYHLLQEHCMLNHDKEMKKFGLLMYEDDEFDQFSNNLIKGGKVNY